MIIDAWCQVDIPIHIHNSDTALVTFTGVGYDTRLLGDTMKLPDTAEQSGVPSIQSVALPGQVSLRILIYLVLSRSSLHHKWEH